MTRPNQGLSSLAPGGGKMRDPGNEVEVRADSKTYGLRPRLWLLISTIFLLVRHVSSSKFEGFVCGNEASFN